MTPAPAVSSSSISFTQHAPPEVARREHSMSTESQDPHVVQLPVSSALAEYLQRMQTLGAVQGTAGALELNPTLAPVLAALHHVLAGGEVEIRISRGGQSTLVQELQMHAERSISETNALIQQASLVGDVAV
jgi:hypothetical protein